MKWMGVEEIDVMDFDGRRVGEGEERQVRDGEIMKDGGCDGRDDGKMERIVRQWGEGGEMRVRERERSGGGSTGQWRWRRKGGDGGFKAAAPALGRGQQLD